MEIKIDKSTKYIYNQRPFLIYWELTRSCDLACKHCRAEALLRRNPLELTDGQCLQMLQDIKDFGAPYPHLVITGGDPLKHPDMFKILAWAKELGIGVSLSPSGTTSLTLEAFKIFKELDVETVSLSLDGATEESHDNFRGVKGCWKWTMEAVEYAREVGMPIQINSLVSSKTVHEIDDIYEHIKTLDIVRWSVFFLIGVGRGTDLRELTPQQAEDTLKWIFNKQKTSPFSIKTTEAPHYRRVAMQDLMAEGKRRNSETPMPFERGFGIRDGNGIMFVSHTGDVYPSGFLPLSAGNVKKTPISEIYRNSELFQLIRDPQYMEGKCGVCEFRYVCGGSRARAYASTGNPYGSDPLCIYQPGKKKNAILQEELVLQ